MGVGWVGERGLKHQGKGLVFQTREVMGTREK